MGGCSARLLVGGRANLAIIRANTGVTKIFSKNKNRPILLKLKVLSLRESEKI